MINMNFDQDVLKIDVFNVCQEICDFIRNQVFYEYRKEGAVVGLSGGIDSAVVCALCVKALGRERVLGLLLPERESSPQSLTYGRLLSQALNIPTEEVDITTILNCLGVYRKKEEVVKRIFPEFDRNYKFKMGLPQDLLEKDRYNYFLLKIYDGEGNEKSARLSKTDLLGMEAANDMKQRTRMIQLYYHAEKMNYLVAGTTNKTEFTQGFYVKFGDGGVDIEPIAHLYKTQVYQVADFLKIPPEIIERTPSPDTYSAEVSDQEFYFCLPYQLLDLLLYAQENKISPALAGKYLNLTEEQVLRVFRDFDSKRRATKYLGQAPASMK
jgi:NAD+ synthase